MLDQKLADEPARLAALRRYEVLDTPREAPFDRITGLVQTIFQVPIALVSLVEDERQWFKSCIGLEVDGTSRAVSFCHYTIQGREPMYIPDSHTDPRFADNPLVTGAPFIRSYIGAPLSTPDGYNVGSLCAIDSRPREYSAEQINMLTSFAALIVDELELRRVAQTDSLTGAATRRGFLVELEKALARANRDGKPNALVMLDLDHFKKVNDTYGHPTGDAVLRNTTAKLREHMRIGDVLGRLGGEEFAILLPATNLDDATAIAERFRNAVAEEPMVKDPVLSVTASFGLSPNAGLLNVNEWIAEADRALYEAKHSGRNRVCLACENGK